MKSSRASAITLNLVIETSVMCDYALTNGFEIRPKIVARLQVLLGRVGEGLNEPDVAELVDIHQRLQRVVAPSTPQALVLIRLEKQRSALMRVLGAVPILRHMMLATLLFLASFVVVGQLEVINEENLNAGLLHLHGLKAVSVLTYLISCAGLGACFTPLYRLNQYVSRATYDPRFDSTYWSALILGVIAGVFISELLYHALFTLDEHPKSGAAGAGMNMGKPALALLGGFSANMVYKVLQRLVDTIESLFKGDYRTELEARRAMDHAKFKGLEEELHSDLAKQLSDVEQTLEQEDDLTAARVRIHEQVEQLLGRR